MQAASQWLPQEIEDTHRLAEALDRLGIAYSWHKVAPDALPDDDRAWILRPVDESKELPATVQTSTRIIQLAQNRLKPSEDEISKRSLCHDIVPVLIKLVGILNEWRFCVRIARKGTYSLYKGGSRVFCRPGLVDDAVTGA